MYKAIDNEEILALMISTAYVAPYVEIDNVSTISSKVVLKLVDMYTDEVKEYMRSNRIRAINSKDIQEDVYLLCSDMLLYIGRFIGGSIPSHYIFHYILEYRNMCNEFISLHTHPVPLPIPTLEDIVSMSQMSYSVECVLSRVYREFAKMMCIEPMNELDNIVISIEKLKNKLFKLVDRYIVVEDDYDVVFIPYPSKESLAKLENEFTKVIKKYAKISIASLDMASNEYEIRYIY